MATTFTECSHPAEFVLTEANGYRSRDNITIVSGAGVVKVGTVLGKITSGGKYTPSPATGTDGSQTGVAINLYQVDATSADVAVAAITRDAEVNKNLLVYEATVDDATKKCWRRCAPSTKITQTIRRCLLAVKIASS